MLEITLTSLSLILAWLTVLNWRKSREIRRMRARIYYLEQMNAHYKGLSDVFRQRAKAGEEIDVLGAEYLEI